MEGLKDTLEFLRSRTDARPEVGLVLGSGLDFFHRKMKVEAAVPYAEIPGFPVSTVAGHAGRFLFGEIAGKKAVVMQGRVHYYEGYSVAEVAALLGLTPSAVEMRLKRGRELLRLELEKEELP